MSTHELVEPLVLTSKAAEAAESPDLLSPGDSSYCGTMKSDDSGIIMDDSQMNYSGDQSDIMFSSTEMSPVEEDTCLLNGIDKSPKSSARQFPGGYHGYEGERSVCVTIVDKEQPVHTEQVAQFFHREGTPESDPEAPTDSVPQSWEDLESESEESVSGESVEQRGEECLVCGTELMQEQDTGQDGFTCHSDEESEQGEGNSGKGVEPGDQPITEANTDDRQEEEGVEFVKDIDTELGLRCNDVQTALQILNTHYKLSDTSARKFIITFSSWNVNQLSHPISKRCSWWEQTSAFPTENPEVEDLMEDIYTRQGEISELVDRIMEEEKLKQDLKRQVESRLEKLQDDDEDIVVVTTEPLQAEPPVNDAQKNGEEIGDEEIPEDKEESKQDNRDKDNETGMPDKKKRRNALQRFLHAMRKRMRRNRPQTGEKDRAKA